MIKWSDAAIADLDDILRYFTDKSEEAAGRRTTRQILESTRRLKTSPFSGRPGYIAGTRELVIRKIPYIIVYIVLEKNSTEVLRVMHTARLWPPDENEGRRGERH